MARKPQGPASNARAGATTEPRELALRAWIDAIASGVTERGAAVEITAEYGFSHGQLAGWCRYDPEWGKALAAAHAAKDSGIALKLAKEQGLNLPLAVATKKQYDRMVKEGLGELDKSGIAELTFKGRHQPKAG